MYSTYRRTPKRKKYGSKHRKRNSRPSLTVVLYIKKEQTKPSAVVVHTTGANAIKLDQNINVYKIKVVL
jgi:hypothetical protein